MIRVENVRKYYGDKPVLRDIDIAIPTGKLTALIGPNGAGKTSLLMLIARLLEPTQGRILIDGRPIAGIPVRDYARRVATLRQSPDFNLRLTVEELVGFGRFPHSRGAMTATDQAAVSDALAFLSIEHLRGAHVDELSGGQRQMAFLAMTIAQQTECLLLDEPLNNLDMKHSVAIMRALRRLCDEQGRTIVLVIHDINFAAAHADHMIAIRNGHLHSSGAVADMVTPANLRSLYDLDFEVVHTLRGIFCNYFNPSGDTA